MESAAWAAVDGVATTEQLALLEADAPGWRRALERMLDDTEENLDAVRDLSGAERDQVLADLEAELERLELAYDRLTGASDAADAVLVAPDPVGEVRLQASWSANEVVVWAAGPDTVPANHDDLSDRLEAIGGPAVGWNQHRGVPLPTGDRAAALSIPVADALGWLVAVGGGLGGDGVGSSVTWLGRVAVFAVRLVARGAIVPTLRSSRRSDGRTLDLHVRWIPADVDHAAVEELAGAMPGPVVAMARADAKAVVLEVVRAVVDAIASDAAGRVEMPAPPPVVRTGADVGEAVITRLDGSGFVAPVAAGARGLQAARALGQAGHRRRPLAARRAARPARLERRLVPVGARPRRRGRAPAHRARARPTASSTKPMADDLARLERLFPVLLRAGGQRRGQVYLSQDEAWELMTVTGATLEAAGFDVRVPALSRRKPSPTLRLFTEPSADTVVGAHQLSDVRWSAVFDDVELTAADIARLAAEARPLVRSRGRWVELDRADLKEAAAALAERADQTQLTGAEILRHAVGLEGSPLAGGVTVEGAGWATDLLARAQDVPTEPVTRPEGFGGELRAYQAEALAWLGFLDAVELGGCLALDMGLGKTPTVLAHIAPHHERLRGPRRRPAGRRRQLGGRGAALHPRPEGRRPPRRGAGLGRRARAEVRPRRHRHHHLRHGRPRHRRPGRSHVGPGRPRRGAGDQEPGQRDRAAAAAPQRPHPPGAHRHAHRERARRPVVHPRLHQPRPGRRTPGVHRAALGRGRGRRCGRSTACSCSAAPRPSPRWRPSCPTASTSSTTAR